MLAELGAGMVAGDQDVGEALVVAQQHIVARQQPLDQIALQQQRLHLGVGDDELHGRGFGDHALDAQGLAGRLRVIGDPLF